jgi:transcription initiation factor TFIIE subunit alpha
MVEETDVLENPAVRAYLTRMVGEEGLTLLENFDRKIEKTDEELAEETGINLNSVRNTLYTLYGKQLAQYRREKNQETGWLTYKWKLRLDNLNDALTDDMEDALEKLSARERYEDENDFYICNNCGIVYTFTDALVLEFTCRCGTQMEHYDNELLLNALKKRVAAIKTTLGKV